MSSSIFPWKSLATICLLRQTGRPRTARLVAVGRAKLPPRACRHASRKGRLGRDEAVLDQGRPHRVSTTRRTASSVRSTSAGVVTQRDTEQRWTPRPRHVAGVKTAWPPASSRRPASAVRASSRCGDGPSDPTGRHSTTSQDRSEDEGHHHGDDLATDHDARDSKGRLPRHRPALDDEDAGGFRVESSAPSAV
jgi:hypothetical protein